MHTGPVLRRVMRPALAVVAAALLAGEPQAHAAGPGGCRQPAWPLWQAFAAHFIQADGRVVDASTPVLHSSSEGQSYGMFFALVAGDAATFDKLWRWSVNNLAGGDVERGLPAWYWGQGQDGRWGVLEDNSASDADLWFTYGLLEAGSRWARDDYLRDAAALLARIEADEVTELPGLGAMLLPGRRSFARPDQLWQLNPSYLPLPVLRRLALASPNGPWPRIAENTAAMLSAVSPKGLVADWVSYRGTSPSSGIFVVDPLKGDRGSYDAIRTYLWAGMTPPADPLAAPVLRALGGMAAAMGDGGEPPEHVAAATGRTEGRGPFGFSAALVPYFTAQGRPGQAAAQRDRAQALLAQNLAQAATRQPPYYDVVLSLFGLGWAERRYRFRPDGRLELPGESPCPSLTAR